MKTKVFQSRLLCPKSALAITLFGLVFMRDKSRCDAFLLNHELVHCHQQREWLYLPFFVLYGIEWLIHYIKDGDRQKAYRKISFEREAYDNQYDLNYLKTRRLFANYRKSKGHKR